MPVTKSDKIWMDGRLVDWDDAKIHILTPTLHYGWGVFEGIRAYATDRGPAVFRLEDHIHRLFRSARIYPPLDELSFSEQEIVEACRELVRINGHDSCYLRPIVYLGYGEVGLNPLNSKPAISIATWKWGAYLGEESFERGVKVMTSSFRRIDKNNIPPAAKATGQYLNSSLAKVEAIRAGYDEAIMLNDAGFIAEATGENLFIVRDGVVSTPPLADGPLGGITRDTVIRLVRDLDLEMREEHLARSDLWLADEAFMTGTAAEVVPIRSADGREIGARGPVTTKVQSLFLDVVGGKVDAYKDWLSYVND